VGTAKRCVSLYVYYVLKRGILSRGGTNYFTFFLQKSEKFPQKSSPKGVSHIFLRNLWEVSRLPRPNPKSFWGGGPHARQLRGTTLLASSKSPLDAVGGEKKTMRKNVQSENLLPFPRTFSGQKARRSPSIFVICDVFNDAGSVVPLSWHAWGGCSRLTAHLRNSKEISPPNRLVTSTYKGT